MFGLATPVPGSIRIFGRGWRGRAIPDSVKGDASPGAERSFPDIKEENSGLDGDSLDR
jgi:hypothetical protein